MSSSSVLSSSSTRLLQTNPASISFASLDSLPSSSDPATESALDEAAEVLKRGGLVAFPTETVYGLGANALDEEAVKGIFKAKGRPSDNPLILHISSLSMLYSLLPPSSLPLSQIYTSLIEKHWPGPLTLLFPTTSALVPSIATASLPTVAVRFPLHPVARALISKAGVPLAAPSANRSGRPSPTRAEHVLRDLEGRVEIVLDGGKCDVGVESTVVDGWEGNDLKVLRPGGVTVEMLEETLREVQGEKGTGRVLVWGKDFKDEKMEKAPTTPGMKYTHYTPGIPVYMLSPSPASASSSSSTSSSPPSPISAIKSLLPSSSATASSSPSSPSPIGLMLYDSSPLSSSLLSSSSLPDHILHSLGSPSDPSQAAQRLFDGLLELEKRGCRAIFVEEGSLEGVGRAVRERLGKTVGGEKGRIVVAV